MEFVLQNVGIINKANIKLAGLTVICGSNNSGKSTAGKALYATVESLSNLDEKLHEDLFVNYRRALMNVSRMLDLDGIYKYVDFEKMQEVCGKDLSMLVRSPYNQQFNSRQSNIVDAFISLKEAVEFLCPPVFLDFLKKAKSDMPKKFFAFLDNFEESREKALVFLGELDKYYFEESPQKFAEKSAAALFSTEFNEQVFPVNSKSKERKSYVSISKNGEIGCSLTLTDRKKDIIAMVSSSKLFVNNAIYIEDPYSLDKIAAGDEFPYFFRINKSMDYSHSAKLKRLLLKKETTSLIEKSLNKEKYIDLIKKISDIIPGVLTLRETGMFYEEPEKEPLKVQNLATGSKMFSIIKNLLEKGEITFDTILILDEPESHLHPEWQNIFAEIIVLLVKELDSKVLLTTHSPNFLMALEAYSKQYEMVDKTNYYMAKHLDNDYLVDYINVNDRLSEIYSSFAYPLIQVKKLKDS